MLLPQEKQHQNPDGSLNWEFRFWALVLSLLWMDRILTSLWASVSSFVTSSSIVFDYKILFQVPSHSAYESLPTGPQNILEPKLLSLQNPARLGCWTYSPQQLIYSGSPKCLYSLGTSLSVLLNFPGNLSVIKAVCNRKKKTLRIISLKMKSLNPNEPFTRLWAPVLIPQETLVKSETKTWEQSDKEKCQTKFWVYLILVFSHPPWVWGRIKKNTEKPPPSCKVHVLSHAFLSLRVQLSPILMELKPNKSSFYAFSPRHPSVLAKSCANLPQFPSTRLWNYQGWTNASTNQFIGVLKLTKT